MIVAEEKSFTRAAARLMTSQPSLSQTVRRLEEKLGVALLIRNTRQVSVTEAGEQLVNTLGPAFLDIENRLQSLSHFRDKPAGTVRIAASEHAVKSLIWPVVREMLLTHPDINIELSVSSGLTDIVKERFDAGIRFGEKIEQDMVAMRIGPDLRMAVVGSPAYFSTHSLPHHPEALTQHTCINLRLPSSGEIYSWKFNQGDKTLRLRAEGQFTVNDIFLAQQAVEEGVGLAILMEDQIEEKVNAGKLIRVLEDWCPCFPGYHIYYPSRRFTSPAFSLFVQKLRERLNVCLSLDTANVGWESVY